MLVPLFLFISMFNCSPLYVGFVTNCFCYYYHDQCHCCLRYVCDFSLCFDYSAAFHVFLLFAMTDCIDTVYKRGGLHGRNDGNTEGCMCFYWWLIDDPSAYQCKPCSHANA